MATHSSILAWRIPWTEELGGLQSMGLLRVISFLLNYKHYHWSTRAETYKKQHLVASLRRSPLINCHQADADGADF